MTHWRGLIEREYLGAWDLVDRSGKPKDWTLEIASATSKKVYSQKIKKDAGRCVLTFKGASKPLIAGATLCTTIEGMYGSDIEQWIGKLVTLYPTTTDVGPKKGVPCIRIRPSVPRGKGEVDMPRVEVDPAMRAKQDEAFSREPGSDDK